MSITAIKALLLSMRLPFIALSLSCVFLAGSVAIAAGYSAMKGQWLLAAIGAMLAHISVNTLNEYSDFQSGLDFNTQKTPYSGGSGALPAYPQMAVSVLVTGTLTLIATFGIGVYFVWLHGWLIVPLGLSGVLLIVTYTNWINKLPVFCLISPGLAFGIFMTQGTYFAVTGHYSLKLLLIGLVPFFQTNNLLLLNQFPDVDADRAIGRYHFPIAYGFKRSLGVYSLFAMMSYLIIIMGVVIGQLPLLSLITLLLLPLAIYAGYGAKKHQQQIGQHPQYLAANVTAAIGLPLSLGITIICG